MTRPGNPVYGFSQMEAKRDELAERLVDVWAPAVNEAIVNGRGSALLLPATSLSDAIHEMALEKLRRFMAGMGVKEQDPGPRVARTPVPDGMAQVIYFSIPERPEVDSSNVIQGPWGKSQRPEPGGTCA